LCDGIQSAFLLEEEAPIAEVTTAECLGHRKIPSLFLKDEQHIVQITTLQIRVVLSEAGQPSPCPTVASQRWLDLNFPQWLQSMAWRELDNNFHGVINFFYMVLN
jgi:hypothetical protein